MRKYVTRNNYRLIPFVLAITRLNPETLVYFDFYLCTLVSQARLVKITITLVFRLLLDLWRDACPVFDCVMRDYLHYSRKEEKGRCELASNQLRTDTNSG